MLLDITKLEVLLDTIRERIFNANENGTLLALLSQIGWDDLLQDYDMVFYPYHYGKIIVLGGSDCPERRLIGVAKELGFGKDRFEFCLDYEEAVKYNYRKLRNDAKYSVILAGPIPHKATGTGEYVSLLSALENEPGYPKVVRLTANNALKITKSNFKAALEELLYTGYLAA